MSDAVTERIRKFAESLLPTMGLELFDIQFRREDRGWVLRLIIDKPDGVTLDDCSRVSRETSDFLDVEDIIDHQFILEVSSPGIERPLRSVEECQNHIGKKVRVKLAKAVDSQRVFIGILQQVDGQALRVDTEEGKTYTLSWSDIVKVRLTL